MDAPESVLSGAGGFPFNASLYDHVKAQFFIIGAINLALAMISSCGYICDFETLA